MIQFDEESFFSSLYKHQISWHFFGWCLVMMSKSAKDGHFPQLLGGFSSFGSHQAVRLGE